MGYKINACVHVWDRLTHKRRKVLLTNIQNQHFLSICVFFFFFLFLWPALSCRSSGFLSLAVPCQTSNMNITSSIRSYIFFLKKCGPPLQTCFVGKRNQDERKMKPHEWQNETNFCVCARWRFELIGQLFSTNAENRFRFGAHKRAPRRGKLNDLAKNHNH